MNKFKIIFIALLYNTVSWAQNKEDLKTEATKMFESTYSKDLNKILSFTYPKVFTIVTKEQMEEMYNNMIDNDDVAMIYNKIEPKFKFEEIIKIDNQHFCKYTHKTNFTTIFKNDITDSYELVIQLIKEKTGAEKAEFNKEKNSITVEKNTNVLAVFDDITQKTWKFINLEIDSQLIKMLFNDSVIQKLELTE